MKCCLQDIFLDEINIILENVFKEKPTHLVCMLKLIHDSITSTSPEDIKISSNSINKFCRFICTLPAKYFPLKLKFDSENDEEYILNKSNNPRLI